MVMPIGPAPVLEPTEEAPPSSVQASRTERGTTCRGHGSSIQERSSDDVAHHLFASSDEADCHPSASFGDVVRYPSETGRSSVPIRTDRSDQSSAAHGTTSVTPQNRANVDAPQHRVNSVCRRTPANRDCLAWMGQIARSSRRRLNHVFWPSGVPSRREHGAHDVHELSNVLWSLFLGSTSGSASWCWMSSESLDCTRATCSSSPHCCDHDHAR